EAVPDRRDRRARLCKRDAAVDRGSDPDPADTRVVPGDVDLAAWPRGYVGELEDVALLDFLRSKLGERDRLRERLAAVAGPSQHDGCRRRSKESPGDVEVAAE